MAADLSNFYLADPLEHNLYTKILVSLISQEFINLYHLQDKIKNGFVYYKILHVMYGLPKKGVLAKKTTQEAPRKTWLF
jgi:hypothetical protein